MEADTAPLRAAAPQWSLAGDKQLLDILHNIHQSLVSRCQEVNRKLDEMVLALDGASIDLQNVNNKFMALSNSQFIESRVFDDDADVAAQEPPKEAPKPEPPTQDLEKLKQSIRALESAHEVIEIIDSDSDESDDEELTRTVLKMRDAYAHRPLPHVIGSQAWRAKWHAGLQLSGSESDSGSAAARDQYSDSEPDAGDDGQGPAHAQPDVEGSSGSSEFPSQQESRVGSLARSPADVAAELARRLGGVPKIPAQETEYSPPPAMTQKVYRPDQPSAGTVFCDEPPPLEQCQSEEEAEEEDDIFAELRRSSRRGLGSAAPGAADELFGRGDAGGDIFSDFRDDKLTSTPTTKKSTLFEDESEPELFADRPPRQDTAPHERQPARPDADAVKKPVGGISLFGNNKGAESIGAAILKRNQRQQSSEDDSDVSPPTKEDSPPKTREKDIFDDLFAKSEREQKMKEKLKEPPKETPKAKVDLFSDNIFDDIDDIFTSNISTVIKKENKNDKPLFDDDDDLFSDIAVSKSTSVAKNSGKEKSIFDSDDDLFSETVKKQESVVPKSKVVASNKLDHVEDIFADIVDKDSGAQSNVINVAAEEITRTKVGVSNENDVPNNDHSKSDESSFTNKEHPKSSKENSLNTGAPNNNMEKPTNSLFGDEEDDELFAQDTKKISASDENSNIVNKSKTLKSHDNLSKGLQKSSLFDDDSDESDLFGSSANKKQVKKENNDVLQKSTSNIISHNNKESLNFSQKARLFDDDETEDIFAATSKNSDVTVTKPTGTCPAASQMEHAVVDNDKTRSLFDDDVNDSDIFGNIATKSTVIPDSLSSIKEHKRTVVRQQVSESNQRDEKPSIENQNLSHSVQNVSAQEPVLREKSEVKSEKSLSKEQKPTVNELKPKLQQKSDINQEKPSTMEHRPNKVPTEPVANIPKDDVTSETKTVDSKVPITKDEINKLSPTKEDLFAKQESHTKTDVLDEPTEYKIPDLDELDKENSLDAKDSILQQPKDSLFNSPAVFDDIFSEPPAFEKSAEPKKSKNVNALFDDDSDDEALFFKKNDVLLDDKPDLSPDANKDALFGIFHDEPPAMDVDFIQKASSSNLNDDFLKTDSDDDMFTIKSKKDVSRSSQKYLVPEDSSKVADDISKSMDENKEITMKSSPVLDKTNKLEQQTKTDSKDATDSDTKKVGKLKTMNFNIDVSTLLPGASPKKKAVEQTDGQVISINKQDNMHTASEPIQKTLPDTQALSTKSHEDLHASDKRERVEHNVFKSVSFDGEPDSNILDNKLSKERAKIQVKRRPSTRRARKEAVRKSAIDIADDSTDNSSSIDDPPRLPKPQFRDNDHQPSKESKSEPTTTSTIPIETNTSTRTDAEINKQKITSESPPVRTNENTTSEIESKNETMAESIHVIDPNIIRKGNEKEKESTDTKTSQIDIVEQSIDTPDFNQIQYVDSRLDSISQSIQNTNADPELTQRTDNKNVTSKVVYILNDEDIFTNPTIENPQKSKVLNIVDDDDDLFRNVPKSSGISTLGNAYKDIASDIEREVKSTIANNANIDSSSIFENVAPRHSKSDVKTDDNKNVDRKPKQSLFGDLSDDENDLFKNKKPSKVKSILDSDSEDDLFGATRKRDAREGQAASAGDASVKPRPEVKSSLFGDDDDDDDLFGVKVKSNVAATSQPARPTKEMVSKTPEPVFDDPLSLLGADDD